MNRSRPGFLSQIPPVTANIIIINLVVWFAQIVFLRLGIDLSEKFGLHYVESSGFHLHQIITYMFLHDNSSPWHLFSNMFAVYMFGRTLEELWGSKRFLTYYIITAIGAALVQLFVIFLRVQAVKGGMDAGEINAVYTNGLQVIENGMRYINADQHSLNILINTVSIGASGAVFGILLAFGMLFPNTELFIIPFPFPIKAKYFVVFYGIFELFFGIANFSGDNVAHFAHVGGIIFGIIMIIYWKKKNKAYGQYR